MPLRRDCGGNSLLASVLRLTWLIQPPYTKSNTGLRKENSIVDLPVYSITTVWPRDGYVLPSPSFRTSLLSCDAMLLAARVMIVEFARRGAQTRGKEGHARVAVFVDNDVIRWGSRD